MQLILDFIWSNPALSIFIQAGIILTLSAFLVVQNRSHRPVQNARPELTNLSPIQKLEIEIDRFWDDQDSSVEFHSGLHKRLYNNDPTTHS